LTSVALSAGDRFAVTDRSEKLRIEHGFPLKMLWARLLCWRERIRFSDTGDAKRVRRLQGLVYFITGWQVSATAK
jgi:hypothetical protein